MTQRILFWINADAELELAAPAGTYRRSSRMAAHCQRIATSLRADLLSWSAPHHALVCAPGDPIPAPQTYDHAIPWCPTPATRGILDGLGPSPCANILRKANHRAFAHTWSQGLPDAEHCTTAEAALACIRRPPPDGADGWILKRGLGFSGRWSKILTAPPSERDATWIRASMHQYGGGLQIEPLVTIESEWSVHGWIHHDVAVSTVIGSPTAFEVDPSGGWAGTRLAQPQLQAREAASLKEHAARTAAALRSSGYWGPFGIDSFRYHSPCGSLVWRRGSDLNARLTMALPAALTDARAPPWPA